MTKPGAAACKTMLISASYDYSYNSNSNRFHFPSTMISPAASFGVEITSPPLHRAAAAASATTTTATTNAINVCDSDENRFELHGRRKALLLATSTLLPLITPFCGDTSSPHFSVLAEEMGGPEYQLMKEEIRKVLTKGKAAGVLRLVFHDAGTFETGDNSGGMNGSIQYELDRPENKGLKKSLKILDKAKNEVDATHSVSWADVISVAGAEAVAICGGPIITVRLGRLDSLTPDPEGKLPEESLDASSLKDCFQRKGFSTQELVALSGAHTLGSKGFGSPTVFDNTYYNILLEKPWKASASMSSMIGLPTDRALADDDECLRWITSYAADQDLFFKDFKNAYIKLVNSGAKWKIA